MDLKESSLDAAAGLEGAAFSADSGNVIVYCSDSTIRQINLLSRAVTRKHILSAANKASYSAFNKGATLIAFTCEDSAARIFDASTGSVKHKLSAHSRYITSVTFTPDSKLVATASEDHTVCIWDVSTGTLRQRMRDGLGSAMAMAFAPSGDRLLVCNSDTDVRLFRTDNGELVRRLQEFPVSMFHATYSQDGRTVAIGGADRTIYLLSASSGKVLRLLTGQPEMIRRLAFSPDGQWLVSSGVNEMNSYTPVEIRLWAVSTGDAVWKTSFPGPTGWLEFSADGRRFGAATSDHAKIWSIC